MYGVLGVQSGRREAWCSAFAQPRPTGLGRRRAAPAGAPGASAPPVLFPHVCRRSFCVLVMVVDFGLYVVFVFVDCFFTRPFFYR